MLHYQSPHGTDLGFALVKCDTPECGMTEKCMLTDLDGYDVQDLIFDYFRGKGWKIAIDPVGWDIRCSQHSMSPDLELALKQRKASSPSSMFEAGFFTYRDSLVKQQSPSSGFAKALAQQRQWVETTTALEQKNYTVGLVQRLLPYLPVHADEPPSPPPKPLPPPASAGRPVFKPKELTEAEKLRPFMLKGPGQGMVRPGLTHTQLQLRVALRERAESVRR